MATPLPEILRPKTLDQYIGQEHIVGKNKIIQNLLQNFSKNKFFPSLIFWGPPGVGKTTLARIIAAHLDRPFFELSAVSTSSKKIEEIIKNNTTPVIFLDEIHRFNKAQQDKLLPSVESGDMTLIGATTENPSFEVIRPLLSRTRVIVLHELTDYDLEQILDIALKSLKKVIDPSAKKFLIQSSNADARSLLNILEIASQLSKSKNITTKIIEEAMQKKLIGFDKQGDEHYNIISAFIKSLRASQKDAAMYYLARMVEAGQDPLYIARRMVVFASEDIGMAQPTALVVANEVFRSCETIGYPECAINLAHGVAYLASAKKDRSAYDALRLAQEDVRTYGNLPIPLKIRNAPTKLMKDLNYGKNYEMYDTESYLPEKLKKKKYF